MQIEEQQAAFQHFYYLTTSIYNEGELAAEQLTGYWKLFSPDNAVKRCEIPIEKGFPSLHSISGGTLSPSRH